MRWRDINHLKDQYNNDITVFFGNYEDFTIQDIELLSEEEKVKAGTFLSSKGRNRYQAGRAFLRRTLGHMLNSGPYKGMLERDVFGKPYVANDKINIHFNISHTGNVIAIAFSFIKPVGIDIESKGRPIPQDFTDYIFTNDEVDEIIKQDDWEYCFLRAWTKKEAVLKCIGCGFIGDAKKIKVPLKDESSLAYKQFSNEDGFQIWHLLPIEYEHNVIGVIAV
ncbi:4'-phosphopantetheinyl transferase family protein [Brenneria rubrifaciens]|uniref:4'-phosphopantetheinyl transferase superfamily protein n=1 Tax=Brenneria rubrifaciens TaxID=55213 RepID=A0A4P8QR00_9GAMM|nr:4'-phosphopantetheinyl transferase superfamily protein [Brenneria rubrifaciens]QCR07680.1 4'-phosphopantetheinyl transferase superfamily protein [Brenneria rubrifaciens]